MSQEHGIYALFSMQPFEQTFKSKEAGRPIFEDREVVTIIIGGDKHSEVVREVEPYDRERFGEAYAKFKRGLEGKDQISGTPLQQWPLMKPSQIREFEAINIYTVEQLAALSDTMKQNIGMGAHELVAAAKAFLDAAAGGALAGQLAAENERLKQDMEALRTQVQTLADRLEAADRKPGRGRGHEAEAA